MKIICFDSDGCVMDTMEIKHRRCFGPCFLTEFGLTRWADELQARWNEINLYETTRGINRFKGLALILREVNTNYTAVPGLAALESWTQESRELSEPALAAAIAAAPAGDERACLKKALAWSRATNAEIAALPEEAKAAFPGAKEGLAIAHANARVTVVSSANRAAVDAEWSRCGLLPYVDEVMAQDAGTKADCLYRLCTEADPADILMVGDAPGDRAAAEQNNVWFYPILARHETESWAAFPDAAAKFLSGEFGEIQPELLEKFEENLRK